MVGRRLLSHFIVGVLVGALASLTISLNLLLAVSAVVLLVAVGLVMPRFALLAGGLVGIGGSWSALMVRQAAICEAAAQVHCGFASYLPLIAIAVSLAAGLLFAALTLRRLAREGRQQPADRP
ncbi:MAG TPA: hypothetical protein VMP67_05480 [Candidatus Limnocylindria bacterium]|nr:hypothetical protein [Candidatus Limnocylindria bacterium]